MKITISNFGRTATAALVACLGTTPMAMAGQDMPGRFWLEFGLGAGNLSEGSNPVSNGGGGMSVDLLVGGRLNPRWSLGLDLSGIGIHPSNANYNPNDSYSSVWGESVGGTRARIQYEPAIDHGWYYSASAGVAYYHNQAVENFFGLSGGRIADGNSWGVRAGYDWPFQRRGHWQLSLGVDTGHLDYNAPIVGSFNFTVVSANVSVALR